MDENSNLPLFSGGWDSGEKGFLAAFLFFSFLSKIRVAGGLKDCSSCEKIVTWVFTFARIWGKLGGF